MSLEWIWEAVEDWGEFPSDLKYMEEEKTSSTSLSPYASFKPVYRKCVQDFKDTIQQKVLEDLRRGPFLLRAIPRHRLVPRFPKYRCFYVSSGSHGRRAQSIQFLPVTVLLSFSVSALAPWACLFENAPSPPLFQRWGAMSYSNTHAPVSGPALLLKGGLTKSHRCLNLVSLCTHTKNPNLSPCLRLVRLCLIVWKCSRENHLSTSKSQVVKRLRVGGGVGTSGKNHLFLDLQ